MVVEELDIIVQANVEQALKELKKISPQIKQTMQEAEKAFSSDYAQGMMENVQKATSEVKKEMKKAFDPNDISGMKITINGEDAKREIQGVSNEMQKLKGKKVDLGNAYDLQRYKEKLQETADTAKEIKKELSAYSGVVTEIIE